MMDVEKWNELYDEFSSIVDLAKSEWEPDERREGYVCWIMDRCQEILERHGLEARVYVEMSNAHTIIIQHCPTWIYT
jgi:hypothetical protein